MFQDLFFERAVIVMLVAATIQNPKVFVIASVRVNMVISGVVSWFTIEGGKQGFGFRAWQARRKTTKIKCQRCVNSCSLLLCSWALWTTCFMIVLDISLHPCA